jgi:hypothetical protein
MSQTSFKKIGTDNFELKQVQENTEQALESLLNNPILNGVLLRSVQLTTGSPSLVEHKLGRKPLGYLVTKRNANATIYDTETTSVAEQNFLKLNTSANVTVDLWIF